jgi:CRP-like cAMP-binding protein
MQAFWAGLFSAASMPLGAITARFWHPSGRVIGSLTAFGAGALLAAAMLDLVTHAIDAGLIVELGLGAVIGSLFFTGLNQVLNKYGGFLRKPATAVAHLTLQQEQHFQELLGQVQRLDIFRTLDSDDLQQLTQALLIRDHDSGDVLYPPGSAGEALYILHSGEVQLLDPDDEMRPFAHLKSGDIFSRMAFFSGAPHGTSALATTDCEIAMLPREDFEDLLETSPGLNTATQNLVQGEEIACYLQQRHSLTLDEVKAWVTQAVTSIRNEARIPDAIANDNKSAEFMQVARQVQRLPIFQYLPNEDIEAVANRLYYRRYKSGETFFYQHEVSEYLYILHQGQVALSDPRGNSRQTRKLHAKDVLGEFSFLTGASHSVTAVADGEVSAWALSKIDFEELLRQSPELDEAVADFLRQETVTKYLQSKQDFSPKQSAQWMQTAFADLQTGGKLPSAQAMVDALEEHGNAPLAIWLGLLIDGIPESLTIGAGVLSGGGVAPTLLAGLFVSNYPEALSSSDGMRQQGFSFPRIVLMWSAVMLMQGVVAGLGSLVLAGASENVVSFIEAIGVGAILTVLTETMLPEAYLRRGYFLGLSLLMGFLAIVLIKTFA